MALQIFWYFIIFCIIFLTFKTTGKRDLIGSYSKLTTDRILRFVGGRCFSKSHCTSSVLSLKLKVLEFQTRGWIRTFCIRYFGQHLSTVTHSFGHSKPGLLSRHFTLFAFFNYCPYWLEDVIYVREIVDSIHSLTNESSFTVLSSSLQANMWPKRYIKYWAPL